MNRDLALQVIEAAAKRGQSSLTEYESKQILSFYDIPVTREILAADMQALEAAVDKIGFPLVMKGCSADISHKTEKNLVRIDIRNLSEARQAYDEIMAEMTGHDGKVLVQEMVSGRRELVMGMTRDQQFGPCVMFGLGGIFTEVLGDIAFRKAPLDAKDAYTMMDGIKSHRILDAIRGMQAVDKEQIVTMLINLGQLALDMEQIAEIDINPLIISGSKAVAVDALIVLSA